jgi:putative spermidine/putrescine transport system permease protein
MIRNPNSGPMAWFGNFGVSLSGCLVLAFLLLPILIVLPLSFSDSRYMSLPLGNFTLRWYEDFFASSQWLSALFNSIAVALASTALAVILGGLAALGLRHPAMPGKRFIEVLLIAPMIVPAVIVGVGMYFVFSNAGLTRTYLGLILAHTTLAVPFVVVNVGSALGGLNQRLLWAAASMGATPWTTLRKVTLPLISPGLVSGGLFAFATSLDDGRDPVPRRSRSAHAASRNVHHGPRSAEPGPAFRSHDHGAVCHPAVAVVTLRDTALVTFRPLCKRDRPARQGCPFILSPHDHAWAPNQAEGRCSRHLQPSQTLVGSGMQTLADLRRSGLQLTQHRDWRWRRDRRTRPDDTDRADDLVVIAKDRTAHRIDAHRHLTVRVVIKPLANQCQALRQGFGIVQGALGELRHLAAHHPLLTGGIRERQHRTALCRTMRQNPVAGLH